MYKTVSILVVFIMFGITAASACTYDQQRNLQLQNQYLEQQLYINNPYRPNW